METEHPVLTLIWMETKTPHVQLNWSHPGTNIFGWRIYHCIGEDCENWTILTTSFNLGLRQYNYPQNLNTPLEGGELAYHRFYVEALSEGGNKRSRKVTVRNGHFMKPHTLFSGSFVRGDLYRPLASNNIPSSGGGITFSSHSTYHTFGQLPAEFLPENAVIIRVTPGYTFGTFKNPYPYEDSGYIRRLVTMVPWMRPSGFVGPSITSPITCSPSGGCTPHQADGEYLNTNSMGPGAGNNGYRTIDPVNQSRWNQGCPSITGDVPLGTYVSQTLNPITGLRYTAAQLQSYVFGVEMGVAANCGVNRGPVNVIRDGHFMTVDPIEVHDEFHLTMYKVYITYAYPPTYEMFPTEGPPVEFPDPEVPGDTTDPCVCNNNPTLDPTQGEGADPWLQPLIGQQYLCGGGGTVPVQADLVHSEVWWGM